MFLLAIQLKRLVMPGFVSDGHSQLYRRMKSYSQKRLLNNRLSYNDITKLCVSDTVGILQIFHLSFFTRPLTASDLSLYILYEYVQNITQTPGWMVTHPTFFVWFSEEENQIVNLQNPLHRTMMQWGLQILRPDNCWEFQPFLNSKIYLCLPNNDI